MPKSARERVKPMSSKAYQKEWQRKNKDRVNAYSRLWRKNHRASVRASQVAYIAKNPNYARNAHLFSKYGITLEQYNLILKSQGGVCALCGKPPVPENKCGSTSMHVDHDHACCEGQKSCGKCIRGIIHIRCNFMLGNSGDNPALLRAAANYLETHHAKRS